MPAQIAPTIQLTLIPRSSDFAAELHEAEFTLIPTCMGRLNERDAESLREPILMATSHLQAHVTRLNLALETGEPDSFELEQHFHGYLLMKSAVEHWRDASPGNRWPNNPEAN